MISRFDIGNVENNTDEGYVVHDEIILRLEKVIRNGIREGLAFKNGEKPLELGGDDGQGHD
jgi:hypothetical protein